MKKHIVTVLACIATTGHATSLTYTGFYISLSGGATFLGSTLDQVITVTSTGNPTMTFPSNIHEEDSSGEAWLGYGYAYQFENHFVLAAEVTAGLMSPELEDTHNINISGNLVDTTVQTKLRNDFAFLFKPGYVFAQRTQVYALLGPRWGNFNTIVSAESGINMASASQGEYVAGISVGTGITHLLSNRINIGLEYAYTDYGSVKAPKASIAQNGATITYQADPRISSNTIAAQLTYHFL